MLAVTPMLVSKRLLKTLITWWVCGCKTFLSFALWTRMILQAQAQTLTRVNHVSFNVSLWMLAHMLVFIFHHWYASVYSDWWVSPDVCCNERRVQGESKKAKAPLGYTRLITTCPHILLLFLICCFALTQKPRVCHIWALRCTMTEHYTGH